MRLNRILCGILGMLAGFSLFEARAAGDSGPEGWRESPFLTDRSGQKRSGETVVTGEGSMTLRGILWDPHAPTAIVNDRVLAVGDRFERWQVMEIRKDKIVLSDGASTRELSVQ